MPAPSTGAYLAADPGQKVNDLDETLTAAPQFLTPPMQQDQSEMPTVESDQLLLIGGASSRPTARGLVGG